MEQEKINIKTLTDYLKRNDVDFSIDENPSTSKIKMIKDAIRKKDALVKLSVDTYQLSMD